MSTATRSFVDAVPGEPYRPDRGIPAGELAALVEEHGRFISYPTAARLTSASVRTLKRLTADGQLPCYHIGRTRTLRVKTKDVLALIVRVA